MKLSLMLSMIKLIPVVQAYVKDFWRSLLIGDHLRLIGRTTSLMTWKDSSRRMTFSCTSVTSGINLIYCISSLLEDLPEMEAIDNSFEFSPESPQCGVLPSDNLDSRSMWIDVNNTVGKSKYLKRHALSSLMGQDNQDLTDVQFIICNSEQMDCAPVKFGEDMISSEQNSLNENSGQEISPEESVLQDLEMVMAQLTEKTQICFRDALYRLAKNSEHHDLETQEEGGYLYTEKSPQWAPHDIKMRSESQKAMESETNAIDRAVANLMFNEMDFSVIREHSSSASGNLDGVIGESSPPVNSKRNVVRLSRPMHYSFNPKIQPVSQQSISQGDAEVPTLA